MTKLAGNNPQGTANIADDRLRLGEVAEHKTSLELQTLKFR